MAAQNVGAPPSVEAVKEVAKDGQVVDPYNVSGAKDKDGNLMAIDYEKLRQQFGTQALTDEHLQRFERVTGKAPHRLLRRKLFFSHRDFDQILDHYEKYGFFLLYTGRGPSSGSMHLGHAIPFLFTKELQDIFDVPLVIMLTDDEKFYFTRNKAAAEAGGKKKFDSNVGDFINYAYGNCKDIIALGFDKQKTFIYSDYEYMGGHFYQNVTEFESLVTNSQVRGAFGWQDSTNIGLNAFSAKQCVAAFATSYPVLFGDDDHRSPHYAQLRPTQRVADIPTLIPCAIDQEPHFRIMRDCCSRMQFKSPKPALVLSKFLTALQGAGGKMSASDSSSAIFMSDTAREIEKKIKKYAFSGGGVDRETHERDGGNPDVDVACIYLSYFLESDEELEAITTSYRKGTLSTGEVKKRCILELQKFVAAFQERRAAVTDTLMREYMTPRKLEFKGNPNPTAPAGAAEEGVATEDNNADDAGEKSGRGTKGERKAAKLAAKKLAHREKKEGGAEAKEDVSTPAQQ